MKEIEGRWTFCKWVGRSRVGGAVEEGGGRMTQDGEQGG